MSGRPQVKTASQVLLMREAGLVVAATLAALRAAVAPGVTTADLDALAHETITGMGAVPSFLGYQGFPASICASVDMQVVHGIPSSSQVLEAGSIVSIDCGAVLMQDERTGWHGDAAITVPVGAVDAGALALVTATERACWAGLAAVLRNNHVRDVASAVSGSVQASARSDRRDYGIVTGYTGHGIGTEMHQDPDVPNSPVGEPRGAKIVPGVVLAVEPMITLGRPEVIELDDDWTVVTVDGSLAAHHEHTVACTPQGPWVLTAPDGGRAALARLGVACGAPAGVS